MSKRMSIVYHEHRYTCTNCTKGSDSMNAVEMSWHLKSTKHKDRMAELDAFTCKPCNFKCKYPSGYNAHLITKAHTAKMNPESVKKLECVMCNIGFRSKREEERHLETPKHAKNVAKLGVDNLAKPILVHALE